MNLVDTHSHIYLEHFADDINETIQRALDNGVTKILLPDIDLESRTAMMALAQNYPEICLPMIGLHPTSVKPETIDSEIADVEKHLASGKFIAVGEIGIDLYWDKTHLELQEKIFEHQLKLALQYKLPVAVHIRDSYNEVWRIIKKHTAQGLTGVLHCFPGNEIQAAEAVKAGLYLGIGGVVTFKNSLMQKVVQTVGLEHIILETDAPYLTPAPYRGKRNEPAYVLFVAQKIAELCNTSVRLVAETTSANAQKLFNF